jgi:hypothetical protein
VFADKLEFSSALVKRHFCPYLHFVSLLGPVLDAAVGAPEHRAPYLRVAVFQSEVPVAGAGGGEIAYFPCYQDPVEMALEQLLGLSVQLADR